MNKQIMVLLAGASASGKSTLARALSRPVFSTSEALRTRPEVKEAEGKVNNEFLYHLGNKLDHEEPGWLMVGGMQSGMVVDSVRSELQYRKWVEENTDVVCVNVMCAPNQLEWRHKGRGTSVPKYIPYLFEKPDYIWMSDRTPMSLAVQTIKHMAGGGFADVVLGAQYGSEGKGKLCALLAGEYDVLVRSGGPNAGHWVRDKQYQYCFHNLPSGTMANKTALVMVAAGASFHPERFHKEVLDTGCEGRLVLDINAMPISPADVEAESSMVAGIGSTAQGVGAAQKRRINRAKPTMKIGAFENWYGPVASALQHQLHSGARVMLEGTQGSGLSLYHGPYPFVTSRDTNVSGLLSEVGIPPTWIRDVWMVVRSLPIRTGGNSGPMHNELSWEQIAEKLKMDGKELAEKERTSTTNRIRRVGSFDMVQFGAACRINHPTKLFLTFADYITPQARGVNEWAKLPELVKQFVQFLEKIASCPVAGVSTGPMNTDVAWKPGYEPIDYQKSAATTKTLDGDSEA